MRDTLIQQNEGLIDWSFTCLVIVWNCFWDFFIKTILFLDFVAGYFKTQGYGDMEPKKSLEITENQEEISPNGIFFKE